MHRRALPEQAQDTDSVHAPGGTVLPTLTHLQFLVFDLIRSDRIEVSSQQLQSSLAEIGIEQHGPKFYQLMKRLEDAGLVNSATKTLDVAGGEVQRTFYKVTNSGIVAWGITRHFYTTRFQAKRAFEDPIGGDNDAAEPPHRRVRRR